MSVLQTKRPRAARPATHLALACLLLAILAAFLAPAATSAFSGNLRVSSGHATATSVDTISAVHAADAVGDLDGHPDDLEPALSRNLLHGPFPWWFYPPCQWGCRVYACIWGWWFGHCRSNFNLYHCFRPKWWPWWPWWPFATSASGLALAGDADSSPEAAAAAAVPPQARSSSARAPPPSSRSSFRQDLAASAPYVACSDDSDCRQLSPSSLAPVDGVPPAAFGNNVISFCERPKFAGDPSGVFADFPGICKCLYIGSSAPPGTLEAITARIPGGPRGGPGPSFPVPGGPGGGPSLPSSVATDNCLQSGPGPSPDHPPGPFFVPGQPPFKLSSRAAARPGSEPTTADVKAPGASISSGDIVGQAFVDGLP